MIKIIWEFYVHSTAFSSFENIYGSSGAWAKLFSKSPAYYGTELLHDAENPERYFTIDSWYSVNAFEKFQKQFAAEYAVLDRECEGMTSAEKKLGIFKENIILSYEFSEPAYCVEYFYAKPDCREQLISALLKLIAPTSVEEGCLQYDLLLDNENPNLLILLVKFTNQQTLQAHEQQPYVKYFSENELQQYCEKIIWNDARKIVSR